MKDNKWIDKEIKRSRKALNKATRKRNSRKTLYPFGFEYKKGE